MNFGVRGEQEDNQIINNGTDTLAVTSFKYNSVNVYLNTNDTLDNSYSLNVEKRIDYIPIGNTFGISTIGNTINFSNELYKNRNNKLKWNVIYRELIVRNTIDTAILSKGTDNSLMGRLEYNLVSLKGFIRSITLYEIGRGREQKREYSYVKVNAGEGYFTWNDYNNDSIKQLNEFENALFSDLADHIRVFIPTNEYQNTYSVQFNQSLSIEPKAIWYTKKGIRKTITRFSSISTLQINRKTLDIADIFQYNPFVLNVADTALVSISSVARSKIFFNRSRGKLGFNYRILESKNKVILVNGFENRINEEQGLQLRWNISRSLTSRFSFDEGYKKSQSEFFSNKNYNIYFKRITPDISYLFKQALRITLTFKFSQKRNIQSYVEENLGGEQSESYNISTHIKYNVLNKGSFNLKFSYIIIDYQGEKNSPAAYSILEGLQPGKNGIWSLSWDRQLGKNMQLGLFYDGRKSESSKMIHIGRAQVRYIF